MTTGAKTNSKLHFVKSSTPVNRKAIHNLSIVGTQKIRLKEDVYLNGIKYCLNQ